MQEIMRLSLDGSQLLDGGDVRRSATVDSCGSLLDLFNNAATVSPPPSLGLEPSGPSRKRSSPPLQRSVTESSRSLALELPLPTFEVHVHESSASAKKQRSRRASEMQGDDADADVVRSFLYPVKLPTASSTPTKMAAAWSPPAPKKVRSAPVRRSLTTPLWAIETPEGHELTMGLTSGLPPLPMPPCNDPPLPASFDEPLGKPASNPFDLADQGDGSSSVDPAAAAAVPRNASAAVAPIKVPLAATTMSRPGGGGKRPAGASSRFRGVTHHIHTQRFEAHLWDSTVERKNAKTGRLRGKQIYLGGFSCEEEAARGYDMAAIVFFGEEKARPLLNFDIAGYDLPGLLSMGKDAIVTQLRTKSSATSAATAAKKRASGSASKKGPACPGAQLEEMIWDPSEDDGPLVPPFDDIDGLMPLPLLPSLSFDEAPAFPFFSLDDTSLNLNFSFGGHAGYTAGSAPMAAAPFRRATTGSLPDATRRSASSATNFSGVGLSGASGSAASFDLGAFASPDASLSSLGLELGLPIFTAEPDASLAAAQSFFGLTDDLLMSQMSLGLDPFFFDN